MDAGKTPKIIDFGSAYELSESISKKRIQQRCKLFLI